MKFQYFHNWNNPNVPEDIVSIVSTQNAVYFASALSGLYEYKNGIFKSFAVSNEFNEVKLKRITANSKGNLVIITDFNDVYELNVLESPTKITNFISHKNIKGSSTAFINEIDCTLFIGTNLGINVFQDSNYYFINKSQGLTNYNLLASSEYNSKLYILTTNGFFVLDKSYFDRKIESKAKAEITKMLVNNIQLNHIELESISKKLSLKSSENNLNILFTVVNEKYPDKLIFKYRVKKNESWIDLVNENEINLSYLDSGIYEIDIQIINDDTGSASVQRLINIEIKPPFYFTWPFILISIIAFILIGLIILNVRIRVIKKELLFDKQLAEVKLQALKSQMNSHFLFNVLSSIQYYIICKDVDNALYYLERFSSLIRKTLDFSDKKEITLNEEIEYLKQYIEIENIRVENEITFNIKIDSALSLNKIKIVPLLLQPFIENAIVHAFPLSIEKPEIILKVEDLNSFIQITIEDNGIGNSKNNIKNHNSKGIKIVNKRLELTQKNFENNVSIYFSNHGTKVVIKLKK